MKSINRFESLISAIEIESEHERVEHSTLLKDKSIHQLVLSGICWYPLKIEESDISIGGYISLIVSIDPQKLQSNVFKAGSCIQLFRNNDSNFNTEFCIGNIYYISNNKAKLIFKEIEEIPDWVFDGKIGFISSIDERTSDVMKKSIEKLIKNTDKEIQLLVDTIHNNKEMVAQIKNFENISKSLNKSQHNAVNAILSENIITTIWGPPGTGKTTTLIEAIIHLFNNSKKILVVAPSNNAVDYLVNKLMQKNTNPLRVGNISRIDTSIISSTLDYKVENSKEKGELKKLKKQIDELIRINSKYKRNFGIEEKLERRRIFNEIKELRLLYKKTENYITSNIIENSKIICTTLIGSESKHLENIEFDFTIIDEAAQSLEAACWVPILKSKKIVLAGDPFQLSPTIKTREAAKLGYEKTLLDIVFERSINVHMLDTQYRMHPKIMQFSNSYFYENKLNNPPSVINNSINNNINIIENILWIDTAGTNFEEVKDIDEIGIYNPEEAEFIFKIFEDIFLPFQDINKYSIGIISPYRKQVKYLQNIFAERIPKENLKSIEIETIDSFQGQERDIILISLVRSNLNNEIGFLKDYRRLNVAMTRAKSCLIIVGDSNTLISDSFFGKLSDYFDKNNALRSAFEYLYK